MTDIVGSMTVRSVWESAVRFAGDRTFLVFEDCAANVVEYSYAVFDQRINQAANLFASQGIRKGDCVIIQLRNSPEFLLCLFGLMKIGAVAVPLGIQGTQREIEQVLELCEVKWAIIENQNAELYLSIACQQKGLLTGGIFAARHTQEQELKAGVKDFNTLLAHANPQPSDWPDLASDDLAEILFTSGTTSRAKGVMLTHANLVFSGTYGIWQVSLRGDDRMISTMPACHSNFQLAALMPALMAGACLVLIERYSARRYWQQVLDHRATVAQMISMMVRTLLMQDKRPSDCQSLLREVLYFMPLSNEEKQAFEQRFNVRVMNSYGSTESIGWAVTDPPYGERRWPSVGRAGLGYEVGILDDEGQELPPGQVGEFAIKGVMGTSIMAGYYRSPELTAQVMTADGWMRTGDKGYCDEDGWFYFVDRKVNMIKRSGENISATEIENVLTAHPAINEAAVIGVPDEVRDEAVKAFVLPCSGTNITTGEVVDWCRGRLADYKIPSLIELVDDFPRTDSMKIEKRLLH
jgi:crotonobetaine/carnitine-CoA ligase